MEDKILGQDEIDKLVQNLQKKKMTKSNGKLSQDEIDKVIDEFRTLTNTDLSQDDIDRIIRTFDQEYKPVD